MPMKRKQTTLFFPFRNQFSKSYLLCFQYFAIFSTGIKDKKNRKKKPVNVSFDDIDDRITRTAITLINDDKI